MNLPVFDVDCNYGKEVSISFIKSFFGQLIGGGSLHTVTGPVVVV